VAKLLEKNADPVHKVTIIPRGPALGVTQQLPKEDRLSMSRDFAKARLAVMMGGRVAEEIVFGQFTTGAGNDIKQASNLARRMVTEFGMSDVVGPISYASDEESIFLGRDFTSRTRNYSETVANQIDDEVRKFIMESYEEARRLLRDHREVLDRIASALLERETLDGEEVDAIVAGRDLPERAKVVIPTYADREKAAKEKRRAASIFGAPKPLPGT
jgi:cell division protease FtsH